MPSIPDLAFSSDSRVFCRIPPVNNDILWLCISSTSTFFYEEIMVTKQQSEVVVSARLG